MALFRFPIAPLRRGFKAWEIHLSALMGLTLCAIAALLGWTLLTSYNDQQKNAERTASNIAGVLAGDIDREFRSLDLSLTAAVEGWRNPDTASLSYALRRMVLFDRSATKQETGSIAIADSNGDVILDAKSERPRKANLSDRDFFRSHRDHPEIGLIISDPLLSRLSGEWVISLSRRLDNPDRSFGGVVTASIRLAFFRSMFERVALGSKSALAIYSTAGKLVMRSPFDERLLGTLIPDDRIVTHAHAREAGVFRSLSMYDSEDRLHAYRRVGAFPFIQSVAISHDEIFSTWWNRAFLIVGVFIGLSFAVAGLTAAFALQLRRRTEAEAALALLARTDALTGLGNRRRFDEGLHYEWRRALSTRQSTALLIIDVDFFKAYNDRYGHLAGDKALTVIASCIARVLRPPADIGARYGGEEFGVILPNTPIAKALRIAEAIRLSVSIAAIEHEGSPHGVVTISIGVAAGAVREFSSEIELVARADRALYGAKEGGRNRVLELPGLAKAA